MQSVKGFKGFYKGIVNRYGEKYELDTLYTTDQPLVWKKSGFHFCENLEDVFRYYTPKEEEGVIICQVTGLGDIIERFDEYYEYNIHIASSMIINSIMTRDEILEYAKELRWYRLDRFKQGFDLTNEELQIIEENTNPFVRCRVIK